MAIKPIDYDALRANVDEMINLMEYDSMRSAGKCKGQCPSAISAALSQKRVCSRSETTYPQGG